MTAHLNRRNSIPCVRESGVGDVDVGFANDNSVCRRRLFGGPLDIMNQVKFKEYQNTLRV